MAEFEKRLDFTAGGADPAEIRTNGFQAGYKPPATFFNWLFTRTSECIDEIHAEAARKVATYYNSTTTFDLDKATESLLLIPKDFSKNCPIASGSGFVYVMQFFFGEAAATSNRTQIAFSYGDNGIGGMAIRHYYLGSWSKWCKFYNTDDKPTAVDVGALPLYTSLTQIGLKVGSETIATISNALPDNSILYIDVTGSNANIYPNNNKDGFLIVEKKRNNRVLFTYSYSENGDIKLSHGTYVLAYNTWTGWKESMRSDFSNATKPLPLTQGGTGATGWHQALTNLRAMERQAMYYSTTLSPDIDILTDSLMLIPHEHSKNCPVGGGFVYIMQLFYGNIDVNSNRTQIAFPYLIDGSMGKGIAIRAYYNGTWSEWEKVGKSIPVVKAYKDGATNTYKATIPEVSELTEGLKITIIPDIAATSYQVSLRINEGASCQIYRKKSNDSGAVFIGSSPWIAAGVPITLTYSKVPYGRWLADTTVTAVTDLGIVPVANGGTGASEWTKARSNLGFVNGSYVGSGQTRNLAIGTPSKVLMVWGGHYKTLITPNSAFTFGNTSGNDYVYNTDELKFENGILTINVATVDGAVHPNKLNGINKEGITYFYQAL